MIPSTSSLDRKSLPSRGRPKSSGWAAFDLQHRPNHPPLLVVEPQPQPDPFPSIPTNSTTYHHPNQVGGSTSTININELDSQILSLKNIHGWADILLIEDVLSAVGNQVQEASTLLKGMAPDSALPENQVTNFEQQHNSPPHDVPSVNRLEAQRDDASFGNTYDLCVLGSALQDCLNGDNNEMVHQPASCVKMFHDNNKDVKLILGQLRTIPVEPEWEEDDIYLTHRKDALKMMRSAAQHSKAATNAFSRGDHSSARQLSLKAQEEWLAAETLNAKAAKEILSIRNSNNNNWKLDLHGLHATEAIQALKEHLCTIETQVQENNSKRSNKITDINIESSGPLIMDKWAKHQTATRQRSLTLQVITGIGNHSRGEASLPTAVKNYLSENGYRFDEARPGVIMVRPKLRLR